MLSQLVSILIPCYNAAPYIAAALDSALAQTWPEKEIIAVNDGSTDGSGEILESYRSRGVKVIHQENRGQCAANNRAFEECSGDYIKFFDADDLLAPRTVELQMERVRRGTTAVASCEWGRFYRDDLCTFKLEPQPVWKDMDPIEWLVESWLAGGGMMQSGIWLVPRTLLDNCGLWNESLSLINDFEFFVRVLCHASEVCFAPGARLYYRSGISGSLSGQKSAKAAQSAFHSLTLGTQHVLAQRNDARARRACAGVLQRFVFEFYPEHVELCRLMAVRVSELGGSDRSPNGTPGFHHLRRVVGWKLARRIEKFAVRHGFNRAAMARPTHHDD
ncbi:MAG: glycosyltransferase [Acidobacteriia bacterium]|nr:glycosyltransferase [Terriglobia bacterium]